MSKTVDLWLDLKSPYSYLAKDPAYALEKDLGATLRLRPFNLDIGGSYNLNDPAVVQRGLRRFPIRTRRFGRWSTWGSGGRHGILRCSCLPDPR